MSSGLQQRIAELEDELDAVRWERDRLRDARAQLQRVLAVQGGTRQAVQPRHVQEAEDRAAEHRQLDRRAEERRRHRPAY